MGEAKGDTDGARNSGLGAGDLRGEMSIPQSLLCGGLVGEDLSTNRGYAQFVISERA